MKEGIHNVLKIKKTYDYKKKSCYARDDEVACSFRKNNFKYRLKVVQ